jgi:hypothetical protein
MKGNIMSNPITKYIVRIPGNTPMGEFITEDDAKKECQKANRLCCPGHQVFAEHADGTVTGPC